MKTLLLMRHAKSSWEERALPDRDRPLNDRGRRDAPRMGAALGALGLCPDRVLASDAVRARSTALALAEAAAFSGSIQFLRDLVEASAPGLLEIARGVEDPTERLMIVGHNPGIEDLVGRFMGASTRMPTAAIAIIELPIAAWRELTDGTAPRAIRVLRPKELKGAGSGRVP